MTNSTAPATLTSYVLTAPATETRRSYRRVFAFRTTAEQTALDLDLADWTIEERVRRAYGSTHRLVTAAGSHVTICNEVDEFGRTSSHRVTGYSPEGRSAYIARNVRARDVARVVRKAEADGWTGIAAGIEGF